MKKGSTFINTSMRFVLGASACLILLLLPASSATAQCLCSAHCILNEWTGDWYCGFGFAQCVNCVDQLGWCQENECIRGANRLPALRNAPVPAPTALACASSPRVEDSRPLALVVIRRERLARRL